ncbi:MAG: transglutaminaseTgpA domain-containing protein, partial [Mycobacteriales bacterium]|nr:transglutaminaseTgpA domain-containing protein [Mycobacteriales bacterium]
MSIRERLTLASALAVGLAASALGPVYADFGWLLRVLGAVAVVGATGLVIRRLSLPVVVQPTLQLLTLALYTSLVFARDTLALGLVPGGDTLRALRALADQGLVDVETLAPPVPTSTGLVLLAVLGVGAIAVLVDVIAVLLARAAVAGLPLLLLFAIPSAVLADGLGWLPFALTASGWLALLLVEGSDRVGRWGTPLRTPGQSGRDDDTSLGRVGRRIGAAALGIAVVVPAILPGLDTRLLDGGSGDGIGGSGKGKSSKTYNPITRLQGDLNLPDPVTLFSYTTNDQTPDYLRMTTLDTFASGQWSASELRADPDDDAVDDGIPTPVSVSDGGVATLDIALLMRIANLETAWLPVPATPTDVDIPGRWVWDAEAETVFSAQDTTGDLDETFSLKATRVLPEAGQLTGVGTVPSEINPYRGDVQLTERVRAELDRIVADADTDYEQVLALQDHLRDTDVFTYDVTAKRAPAGRDPLEFFLLDNQRGFCEQYASAMAALTRALGLPSRVAVGFTPGSLNEGTWTVTTNEAHAWPEVWFEGAGWVRFEPTPRTDTTSVPPYAQPETSASGGPTAAPSATAEPSAAPSSTASTDPGGLLDPETGEPTALDDPAAGSGALGVPPLPVLLLLLALVLSGVPALAGVLRRRHRRGLPGPLPAWAQVHDDAADIGHLWRPADSPRAAARRLVAERALPADAAAALG